MEHKTEVIYDIKGFDDPINGYVEDFSKEAERANSSEEARITVSTDMASMLKRGKYES